jgi:hypothetical protein
LRSKLVLLQTLFGVVAAASTFSNHLLDSPVVLLLMPGMVVAIALSGNVRAFPIWVAACGNYLFYFLLLWLATAAWNKVRMKVPGRKLDTPRVTHARITPMETPKPLIDKTESRRIRVEIRRVLLNVWDPIGVKDEPNAHDEYDGYVGRVYELLVSKASQSELVDYLYWAVHDNMGLGTASRVRMVGTAEALRLIPLGPTQGL